MAASNGDRLEVPLSILDPRPLGDLAAVRAFVRSEVYQALANGVAAALEGYENDLGGTASELSREARDAAYCVVLDLTALARAAAGDVEVACVEEDGMELSDKAELLRELALVMTPQGFAGLDQVIDLHRAAVEAAMAEGG